MRIYVTSRRARSQMFPLSPRPLFGQLLYFSLATLTTTGYGDIVPLHPLARKSLVQPRSRPPAQRLPGRSRIKLEKRLVNNATSTQRILFLPPAETAITTDGCPASTLNRC